ncbi:MAG TPA: hypothetical protein VJ767_08580, partial [Nitrososphaeraceae archaeon]|nr:hypothetical protein [Nitrososphaeraceae archaeon]
VFMKKEDLIEKTSFIILFSFFLLIVVVTTYFINENLVFSQQNKYKDPKSVNQENAAGLHKVEIKHQQANFSNFDIFGIKEIYPTKKNGFEWFMNNYDPESDPYLHNYKSIVRNDEDDGSYSIGERSRMGVYSKDGIGYPKGNMETYNFTELSKKGYWYKPTDWKNVEITGEYLYKIGEGPGITHYARSEDHSLINNGCGGSSYKLKIHFDGTSSISKEQTHPKPWKIQMNKSSFGKLDKDWFRFKGIMYNLPDGTVKLENWLDPFLNNTWIKIAEYHDKGGWGKDGNKCQGKEDQIITWGSPTATFRWDDVLVDFRNLSVREIQPPII